MKGNSIRINIMPSKNRSNQPEKLSMKHNAKNLENFIFFQKAPWKWFSTWWFWVCILINSAKMKKKCIVISFLSQTYKGNKWSVVRCLRSVWFKLRGSRAAAPKGTKLCITQGKSVPPFIPIWAIWQYLGQNRPRRRQNPEDGAGTGVCMYVCMDGWTDRFPCVLQDFRAFRAAAQKGSLISAG